MEEEKRFSALRPFRIVRECKVILTVQSRKVYIVLRRVLPIYSRPVVFYVIFEPFKLAQLHRVMNFALPTSSAGREKESITI